MQAQSSKLTILIAEDELLLAMDIEDIVRRAGCRVVGPAADLSEVLHLIDTAPVDAALLDVSLSHGERIYPAAERLAARNIPFVFMTAYGEGGIEPGFAERPVLKKPFTEREVASWLHRLAASDAAHRKAS